MVADDTLFAKMPADRKQSDFGVMACHSCDRLHTIEPRAFGERALCSRCGTFLYRSVPDSINRCLALYIAALALLLMANFCSFITLDAGGTQVHSVLLTGAFSLFEQEMGVLGLVVIVTSVGFPAVVILGMLWLLLPASQGRRPWLMGPVFRLVQALMPWSLIGVFMLGTLVAAVKLQGLATVTPGFAVAAVVALMLVMAAARASFEPEAFWRVSGVRPPATTDILPGTLHLSCHDCGLLHIDDSPEKHSQCRRCGAGLHQRKTDSVQRTWALVASACLLLLPANIYPIMTVAKFGAGKPDTILSGVQGLISGGYWGLAFIVLFASLVVPLMKLLMLAYLLISVRRRSTWRPRDRTRLYQLTELVGAWSMIDIYLVALLTGLVQLGLLANVTPHVGAVFFCGVVVITMLAAHSFDPRLIWDEASKHDSAAGRPEKAVVSTV